MYVGGTHLKKQYPLGAMRGAMSREKELLVFLPLPCCKLKEWRGGGGRLLTCFRDESPPSNSIGESGVGEKPETVLGSVDQPVLFKESFSNVNLIASLVVYP